MYDADLEKLFWTARFELKMIISSRNREADCLEQIVPSVIGYSEPRGWEINNYHFLGN